MKFKTLVLSSLSGNDEERTGSNEDKDSFMAPTLITVFILVIKYQPCFIL
ncbi:hypothetical protein VIBR0546_10394 [Vibrio brasiliensis LMG 20546]|uniref:Uncharacterized protein n=1 Tax=Vibrio brasiliensis LMG 20546 TaxID=945543 RepID=E8LU08_9VIBR|nr:hypothetical protein VIBR0546_10394 [Vibrio brasiliensis LMG 20546]